jgi:hypothetical protein
MLVMDRFAIVQAQSLNMRGMGGMSVAVGIVLTKN